MKKSILFLLLSLVATIAVNAQSAVVPQAKAKKALSKIHTAVKLESEQTSKVNAALIDYYTKKEQIEKNTTMANKEQGDKKIDALKDARDKQLRSILTSAQWKKWVAYKEKEKDEKKDSKDKKEGKE